MPVTSISLDKRNLLRQGRLIWLIALALVCAVIAGTRIFGNSPDYISYDQFFDIARQYHLEALKVTRFESGFVILSLVFTTLFSLNTSVYAALVFISMLLKGWVIFLSSTTLSIFSIIALLYLIRYFSLHELTQLRAALGIGLVLIGTSFIWRGSILYGTIICVSSLFFHLSSFAVIPALYFSPVRRNQAISISLYVFLGALSFSGLIALYLGNFIPILGAYLTGGFDQAVPTNPFATQLLLDIATIVCALFIWDRLTSVMRRSLFLVMLGLAIFYATSGLAGVAHRMREFYSVFWILFFAAGLSNARTKVFCYFFILLNLIFYTYVFFISGSFFN